MPEMIPIPSPPASWLLEQAALQAESAWRNISGDGPKGWVGPAARAYHSRVTAWGSASRALAVDLRAALDQARAHEQELREVQQAIHDSGGN